MISNLPVKIDDFRFLGTLLLAKHISYRFGRWNTKVQTNNDFDNSNFNIDIPMSHHFRIYRSRN